jgi:hypothetical protein
LRVSSRASSSAIWEKESLVISSFPEREADIHRTACLSGKLRVDATHRTNEMLERQSFGDRPGGFLGLAHEQVPAV